MRRQTRHATRRIGLAAALVLLGGCQLDWVREHPLGCRADEQRAVRDTLYFGRSIPGGDQSAITPVCHRLPPS
jgi:hypothetical protein